MTDYRITGSGDLIVSYSENGTSINLGPAEALIGGDEFHGEFPWDGAIKGGLSSRTRSRLRRKPPAWQRVTTQARRKPVHVSL